MVRRLFHRAGYFGWQEVHDGDFDDWHRPEQDQFSRHRAQHAGRDCAAEKFSRKQLLQFTSKRQQMLIGMEACGGAHFLGRTLRLQGHDAKLMQAQFVKAYRKSNKRLSGCLLSINVP
jgi:transposase